MVEKRKSARLVFLDLLDEPQNLTEAIRIDADGDQQRHTVHFPGPGPFQHDAVHINVRILNRGWRVAPFLDLGINLLVQARRRPGTDPLTLPGFRDILDPAD